MPDAVLNSTFGTGFSMILVICATLACASNDIDDPESSITSRLK